jgi:hypothetical protein
VSDPAAIIKRMPVYELWIKRAAHLDPEEHIFDSGFAAGVGATPVHPGERRLTRPKDRPNEALNQ